MESDDSPDLIDEFDVLYIRGIFGWSDLHVVTRRARIAVRITHIFSDPIEDLSVLCCGLLRHEPRTMATLCDEPGSTVIVASVYPRQRHIARIEFWKCVGWDDVSSQEDGTLILSADVKIRQFVGLMYRQIEKVRWLYKEESFQEKRDPFPHSEFEVLEQMWINRRD